MSFNAEQRRFNWIHAYCEAMRLALVNELTEGQPARIATLPQLGESACAWWLAMLAGDEELRRWLAHKRGRGCYWSALLAHDFYYLYDLEAELWGANVAQFLDCTRPNQQVALEPFRFVLLFYLIERALKLLLAHLGFLNYELGKHSHARIREGAYAYLFEQAHLARWLPFPFNLTALSRRLVHGYTDFIRHAGYKFNRHHFSVVGKAHYTDVLESALCQAVSWQRERHTNQGHPPALGSIQAFFFDPLWRYSESYRYRLPLAGDFLRQNPFYWSLNLRWLGSALLELIELWLYTLSAQHMRELWHTYAQQSRSPTLPAIQLPRWQAIQAAAPQLVVL
jgi:hypothetical protein